MNYQQEIDSAASDYMDKIDEDFYPDFDMVREAFHDGAKKSKELILEELDSYVDKMVKDIPTPSYDYEEGLRVAFLSVQEWLHNRLE